MITCDICKKRVMSLNHTHGFTLKYVADQSEVVQICSDCLNVAVRTGVAEARREAYAASKEVTG